MVSQNDRTFVGVSNASTGQMGSPTRFRYHQDGEVFWAEHEGGEILRGYL